MSDVIDVPVTTNSVVDLNRYSQARAVGERDVSLAPWRVV